MCIRGPYVNVQRPTPNVQVPSDGNSNVNGDDRG